MHTPWSYPSDRYDYGSYDAHPEVITDRDIEATEVALFCVTANDVGRRWP